MRLFKPTSIDKLNRKFNALQKRRRERKKVTKEDLAEVFEEAETSVKLHLGDIRDDVSKEEKVFVQLVAAARKYDEELKKADSTIGVARKKGQYAQFEYGAARSIAQAKKQSVLIRQYTRKLIDLFEKEQKDVE